MRKLRLPTPAWDRERTRSPSAPSPLCRRSDFLSRPGTGRTAIRTRCLRCLPHSRIISDIYRLPSTNLSDTRNSRHRSTWVCPGACPRTCGISCFHLKQAYLLGIAKRNSLRHSIRRRDHPCIANTQNRPRTACRGSSLHMCGTNAYRLPSEPCLDRSRRTPRRSNIGYNGRLSIKDVCNYSSCCCGSMEYRVGRLEHTSISSRPTTVPPNREHSWSRSRRCRFGTCSTLGYRCSTQTDIPLDRYARSGPSNLPGTRTPPRSSHIVWSFRSSTVCSSRRRHTFYRSGSRIALDKH